MGWSYFWNLRATLCPSFFRLGYFLSSMNEDQNELLYSYISTVPSLRVLHMFHRRTLTLVSTGRKLRHLSPSDVHPIHYLFGTCARNHVAALPLAFCISSALRYYDFFPITKNAYLRDQNLICLYTQATRPKHFCVRLVHFRLKIVTTLRQNVLENHFASNETESGGRISKTQNGWKRCGNSSAQTKKTQAR